MMTMYPFASNSVVTRLQEDFLQILPSVQQHAHCYFRHLGAEAREEAVAQATALAFATFRHLQARGKDPLAFRAYRGQRFGHTLGRDVAEATARLRRLLNEIEDGSYLRPSEARQRPMSPRARKLPARRQTCTRTPSAESPPSPSKSTPFPRHYSLVQR